MALAAGEVVEQGYFLLRRMSQLAKRMLPASSACLHLKAEWTQRESRVHELGLKRSCRERFCQFEIVSDTTVTPTNIGRAKITENAW
jgi:hypothetical protein